MTAQILPHIGAHTDRKKIETIFITGATGELGTSLLPLLLRAYPDASVYCLIRSAAGRSIEQRFQELCLNAEITTIDRARLRPVRGDACQPKLGMDMADWIYLSDKADAVFHLSASVDFALPLEESRRQNVGSTENMLEFVRKCAATRGSHFRFNYVSTAYVCGKRTGPLAEAELDLGQTYWNGYEQSKAEAEKLVQALIRQGDIATTIYRPSQITSNSRTGKYLKPFGFHAYLGLMLRFPQLRMAGNAETHLDMVPVDYVSKAIVLLSQYPAASGKTYHLAAGLAHSPTVGALMDNTYDAYKSFWEGSLFLRENTNLVPMPQIVSEEDVLAMERLSIDLLLTKQYTPYTSYDRDFDVKATHDLLVQLGLPFPNTIETVRRTVSYTMRKVLDKSNTQVQREAVTLT